MSLCLVKQRDNYTPLSFFFFIYAFLSCVWVDPWSTWLWYIVVGCSFVLVILEPTVLLQKGRCCDNLKLYRNFNVGSGNWQLQTGWLDLELDSLFLLPCSEWLWCPCKPCFWFVQGFFPFPGVEADRLSPQRDQMNV